MKMESVQLAGRVSRPTDKPKGPQQFDSKTSGKNVKSKLYAVKWEPQPQKSNSKSLEPQDRSSFLNYLLRRCDILQRSLRSCQEAEATVRGGFAYASDFPSGESHAASSTHDTSKGRPLWQNDANTASTPHPERKKFEQYTQAVLPHASCDYVEQEKCRREMTQILKTRESLDSVREMVRQNTRTGPSRFYIHINRDRLFTANRPKYQLEQELEEINQLLDEEMRRIRNKEEVPFYVPTASSNRESRGVRFAATKDSEKSFSRENFSTNSSVDPASLHDANRPAGVDRGRNFSKPHVTWENPGDNEYRTTRGEGEGERKGEGGGSRDQATQSDDWTRSVVPMFPFHSRGRQHPMSLSASAFRKHLLSRTLDRKSLVQQYTASNVVKESDVSTVRTRHEAPHAFRRRTSKKRRSKERKNKQVQEAANAAPQTQVFLWEAALPFPPKEEQNVDSPPPDDQVACQAADMPLNVEQTRPDDPTPDQTLDTSLGEEGTSHSVDLPLESDDEDDAVPQTPEPVEDHRLHDNESEKGGFDSEETSKKVEPTPTPQGVEAREADQAGEAGDSGSKSEDQQDATTSSRVLDLHPNPQRTPPAKQGCRNACQQTVALPSPPRFLKHFAQSRALAFSAKDEQTQAHGARPVAHRGEREAKGPMDLGLFDYSRATTQQKIQRLREHFEASFRAVRMDVPDRVQSSRRERHVESYGEAIAKETSDVLRPLVEKQAGQPGGSRASQRSSMVVLTPLRCLKGDVPTGWPRDSVVSSSTKMRVLVKGARPRSALVESAVGSGDRRNATDPTGVDRLKLPRAGRDTSASSSTRDYDSIFGRRARLESKRPKMTSASRLGSSHGLSGPPWGELKEEREETPATRSPLAFPPEYVRRNLVLDEEHFCEASDVMVETESLEDTGVVFYTPMASASLQAETNASPLNSAISPTMKSQDDGDGVELEKSKMEFFDSHGSEVRSCIEDSNASYRAKREEARRRHKHVLRSGAVSA